MFNALAIGMCNGWSMGLSNALNFSSCLNFLFFSLSFSFWRWVFKSFEVTAVRSEVLYGRIDLAGIYLNMVGVVMKENFFFRAFFFELK